MLLAARFCNWSSLLAEAISNFLMDSDDGCKRGLVMIFSCNAMLSITLYKIQVNAFIEQRIKPIAQYIELHMTAHSRSDIYSIVYFLCVFIFSYFD